MKGLYLFVYIQKVYRYTNHIIVNIFNILMEIMCSVGCAAFLKTQNGSTEKSDQGTELIVFLTFCLVVRCKNFKLLDFRELYRFREWQDCTEYPHKCDV